MSSPEQLIAAARSWLGTPYVHQGRLKGVGVDCVGLVACAALEAGVIDPATYARLPLDYSRQANLATLRALLGRHLRAKHGIAPGDVLSFRFTLHDQHLGLATDLGVIHCLADSRGVSEVPLGGPLHRALSGVWGFAWGS